ncbi:MAG: class I SAM-dependent methyltransferase [Gammaproteobacteria bacterium]|nr:class I SAM-dependent methyltransferase [Gammaproteobacteria bacterium]
MGHSARFWDWIAKRYSKQPIADEATYEKKLWITRGYFQQDMQILEFGCGTGSTALLHAPYLSHIRAIDVSPKMIEIAQAKADAGNIENITFECMAIDEFSAPDQSFDAVLGLNILHLLENMEDVIAKVYDMLRPGGVFITSTACVGDMKLLYRIIAPVGNFLRVIPLVKVFTSKEFQDSLTSAGFQIDHQWQPGKDKAVFVVAKKGIVN